MADTLVSEQHSFKKVKNIIAIGDGAVGKTCLLHAFTEDSFFEDYVPTM